MLKNVEKWSKLDDFFFQKCTPVDYIVNPGVAAKGSTKWAEADMMWAEVGNEIMGTA